jgi:anti-anti-sigma factor
MVVGGAADVGVVRGLRAGHDSAVSGVAPPSPTRAPDPPRRADGGCSRGPGVAVAGSGPAVSAVAERAAHFGMSSEYWGAEVVVGVRGELDVATAPELAGLLGAVIDCGHVSVVLDMAALDFMDSSGLAVIGEVATRLAGMGGEITIRSASEQARQIMAVTKVDTLVRTERVDSVADDLGPEEATDTATAAAGSAAPASSPMLPVVASRRLTSLPADRDVVDAALRLVVALARKTVGGADGVSISLRRHGVLSTVAASDQTILDMDADQYGTGQGPCVDASTEGRWFHAHALGEESRWPAFTPRAQALGINAILSSPLKVGAEPVGALNIYSRRAGAFGSQDEGLASVFASEASAVLTEAGVDVSDAEQAQRMQEALEIRHLIARAQGVVMERERLGAEAAFTWLRRRAHDRSESLRTRAGTVIASTQRPRPVAGPPQLEAPHS